MNYQQFLLYSENNLQKINDSVGYEMQCFFTSRNSPKRHSRKCLNPSRHETKCWTINQSSDILQHSQNRPTADRWLKF